MLICNAEIIKKIKSLEESKKSLLDHEVRSSSISYSTEKDKVIPEYNFNATRKAVADVDKQIRQLKYSLAVSNSTTIVPDFNMTIGECLIYMVQLGSEKDTLERMSSEKKKDRRVSYGGVIEFTELTYDKDECNQQLNKIKEEIHRLQIAIDRTNLNNMIEI